MRTPDSGLPTCLRRTRLRRASHSVGGRACNAPLQTRTWTRLRRARKNAPVDVDAPATRLQKRACGRASKNAPVDAPAARLQKRACGRACNAPAMYRGTPLARLFSRERWHTYNHAVFLLAGRRAWITACARLLYGRAPEHAPSPPLLYACPVLRPVLARVRPSRLCGGCVQTRLRRPPWSRLETCVECLAKALKMRRLALPAPRSCPLPYRVDCPWRRA